MKLDEKILKHLYQNKFDGNFHTLFEELNTDYEEIIGPIEDLATNGLITRIVEETLGRFEDPDPNFDYRKTNTQCKISQAGILYYEKYIDSRSNRILSVIALIISIGTFAFTILNKFILVD